MPEYLISSKYNQAKLGETPNTNGEFPLERPAYGIMDQRFSHTPEGLILMLTNKKLLGPNTQYVEIDERGRGRLMISRSHSIEINLAEDRAQVVAKFKEVENAIESPVANIKGGVRIDKYPDPLRDFVMGPNPVHGAKGPWLPKWYRRIRFR